MENILTLTYFELKKFWTIKRAIIFGAFFIVIIGFSLLPNALELPTLNMQINLDSIIVGALAFFVPVFVLLFTGGIISNDIRTFYLRTVLSRPVSKEEYLTSKYLFAFINLIISTILFAVIPSIVGIYSYGGEVNLNIGTSFLIYSLYLIEGLLFISISIFLSTFLKGFFNIFVLAIWIFLESSLINGVVSNFVSFSKPLAIISDFFFPAGFSEASKLINTGSILFYESIMWGIASLAFFVSLSYYRITKISIDSNMD